MRPDVTKAQVVAAVGAGVPIVVSLLAAFGVFVPSPAEQHALTEATKWAAGFAALLVGADAHLRASRNKADAVRSTAHRTDAATRALGDTSERLRAAVAVPRGSEVRAVPASAEPGREAVDEGPGDPDVLPAHGVADPERITPDEGDAGSEVTP